MTFVVYCHDELSRLPYPAKSIIPSVSWGIISPLCVWFSKIDKAAVRVDQLLIDEVLQRLVQLCLWQ